MSIIWWPMKHIDLTADQYDKHQTGMRNIHKLWVNIPRRRKAIFCHFAPNHMWSTGHTALIYAHATGTCKARWCAHVDVHVVKSLKPSEIICHSCFVSNNFWGEGCCCHLYVYKTLSRYCPEHWILFSNWPFRFLFWNVTLTYVIWCAICWAMVWAHYNINSVIFSNYGIHIQSCFSWRDFFGRVAVHLFQHQRHMESFWSRRRQATSLNIENRLFFPGSNRLQALHAKLQQCSRSSSLEAQVEIQTLTPTSTELFLCLFTNFKKLSELCPLVTVARIGWPNAGFSEFALFSCDVCAWISKGYHKRLQAVHVAYSRIIPFQLLCVPTGTTNPKKKTPVSKSHPEPQIHPAGSDNVQISSELSVSESAPQHDDWEPHGCLCLFSFFWSFALSGAWHTEIHVHSYDTSAMHNVDKELLNENQPGCRPFWKLDSNATQSGGLNVHLQVGKFSHIWRGCSLLAARKKFQPQKWNQVSCTFKMFQSYDRKFQA